MSRLPRFLLASFCTLVLVVAGCDTIATDEPPDEMLRDTPAATKEALLVPWPENVPLLEPGPDGMRGGLGNAFSSHAGASAYGCLVSTLNSDTETWAYRYQDFYVHLPEGLVQQVGDEVQHVAFIFSSEHADGAPQAPDPLHEEADVFEVPGRTVVIRRLAQCLLPGGETPAAVAARELVRRRLERKLDDAGPAQAITSGKAAPTASTPAAVTAAVPGAAPANATTGEQGPLPSPDVIQSFENVLSSLDSTCASWSTTLTYTQSTGVWMMTDWSCTQRVPPPPPGGGSGGGGGDGSQWEPIDGAPGPGEPSAAEQLAALLEAAPYALLDVPCDQIPQWQALVRPVMSDAVRARLEQVDEGFIQTLDAAFGAVVNLDYYGVRIPVGAIPNGMTAEEYVDHIRTNINSYIDTQISRFEFYPGLAGERARWEGNDPAGTMFSIQLTPWASWIEDGTVIASQVGARSWIFTTMWSRQDFDHPVSGNRRFGYTDNGNGTITFYTRGVDRLTNWAHAAQNWLTSSMFEGGVIFNGGDRLWKSLQEKVAADVGGQAEILEPVTYHPQYDEVRQVLLGASVELIDGCR